MIAQIFGTRCRLIQLVRSLTVHYFIANGRIPALVDNTSGKPKRVFEGASMQLYLCEKYDKDHKISFPYDSDEYWETVEWLVWMVRSRYLLERYSVWWRQDTRAKRH
jgi:glutathione S-transferase